MNFFRQVTNHFKNSEGNKIYLEQSTDKVPKKSNKGYKGSYIFKELRDLRLRLSKEVNLPPFCIFDNKTLSDLCEKLPNKKEYLVFVLGFSYVGTPRTDKYADEILNTINHYLKENNLRSPLEDIIPSYKEIIVEFVSKFNYKFKDKEIANILSGNQYIKTTIERIDDYCEVVHSDFYAILSNCKIDGILYLIFELIEQQLLIKTDDDYILIKNEGCR